MRPCPRCGRPRDVRARRCANPECGWRRDTPRRADLGRDEGRRREAVRLHREIHGDVCPGWQVPAHAASDLTADHPIAVALGGDPDQELVVLCRRCNGRKGAAEGRELAARRGRR